jgi:hypothetical protein
MGEPMDGRGGSWIPELTKRNSSEVPRAGTLKRNRGDAIGVPAREAADRKMMAGASAQEPFVPRSSGTPASGMR